MLLIISFEPIVRVGELRRKSVRVTAMAEGSTVGSDMERPCIIGRPIWGPRSVRVSRDFSASGDFDRFLERESFDLRVQQKMSSAATMTPMAMPGMKPAAKDLPLNVVPDELVEAVD